MIPHDQPHGVAQKRLRLTHTKSRNGCYTCKSRRVKCDEVKPTCGACTLRGEACGFPTSAVPPRHTPRQSGREIDGADFQDAGAGSRQRSRDRSSGLSSCGFPHALQFDLPSSSVPARTAGTETQALNMVDLQLLSHFMIHTSKKMSLNPSKRRVWETVIPNFAAQHEFLMHLLLALAGLDYFYPVDQSLKKPITTSPGIRAETDQSITKFPSGNPSPTESSAMTNQDIEVSDLQIVIAHHQRGLQGFRDQLSILSNSNYNEVFAGSVLLVGFAFASLRVRNLNDPHSSEAQRTKPRLDWISLIRGLTTVIRQHWPGLKLGPFRDMLQHNNATDDWKMYPRGMFMTVSPRQKQFCSPRILKFCQGASEALTSLKSFGGSITSSMNGEMGQDSPPSALEQFSSAQNGAIGILEEMYMRILYVVQFCRDGTRPGIDIQADMEAAAITGWPGDLSEEFLATLKGSDMTSNLSFVILAYFYLTLALFEAVWFLKGAFDEDIMKTDALIKASGDEKLMSLMEWPVSVLTV